MKLAADPVFELAKDFIVEGLTYKLDQKDKNQLGEKLKINIHPRVYYGNGGDGPTKEGGPSDPSGGNPMLNKLFANAVAQRQSQPVMINKDKFYQN